MTSMLTKIKLFTKFALKDIECGHHSGFKPCCIFFYAILDNASRLHKNRFYNGRRYINYIVQRLKKRDHRYIPCPYCLFTEPVVVKKCDYKSGHSWNFWTSQDVDALISLGIREGNLHENLVKLEEFFDDILGEKVRRYY